MLVLSNLLKLLEMIFQYFNFKDQPFFFLSYIWPLIKVHGYVYAHIAFKAKLIMH